MAKEKKAAAQAAKETTPVVENPSLTEENIVDAIKSENKMEEDIVKAAEEQIKKEKDAKKKSQMMTAILVATYINRRELLALKKRRDEAKATKTALTATLDKLNDLKGGKLTPREYEKAITEVAEAKAKEFNEITKKYDELEKELCGNFPNYYTLEWEYDRWANNHRNRFGW